MNKTEFNDMLWEAYPWDGEKMDYAIRCPALSVSFDNGGFCRNCRNFTADLLDYPTKPNPVFRIVYNLLGPKPRMCSRDCLYEYICKNFDKILEEITQ